MSGATLEFFGYNTKYIPNNEQTGKRSYHVVTHDFAEKADEQGMPQPLRHTPPRAARDVEPQGAVHPVDALVIPPPAV